jgi:hypothetical protein
MELAGFQVLERYMFFLNEIVKDYVDQRGTETKVLRLIKNFTFEKETSEQYVRHG